MSDPVFNESDYAYLGRAVADAYRYALRRQRDSSPSSCSGFRCDCEGVEMGSYGNQIWVHAPAHMPKGNGYCLDACVAEEVMQLWMRGVTTHGCCCGHGEDGLAYIQVAESGISAMENLGYERRKNPMHPDARDLFIPRGVGHFSQNTPDPRRESGES